MPLPRAEPLPDRTTGAALFADISGFTVLAEALVRELGPHRGAEELTHYLNLVYDVIIDHLHHYGGSVIAFAGDAITCWLDGDDGRRAVGCGLAMQESMAQFAEVRTPSGSQFAIGLTVAVATGPARRFQVGDPEYTRDGRIGGRNIGPGGGGRASCPTGRGDPGCANHVRRARRSPDRRSAHRSGLRPQVRRRRWHEATRR